MAYYLTVQKKNGEYKELDITYLEKFERISRFKSGYSLEEIDNFTSKYNGEVFLKSELFDCGIIDFDDITREISIRQAINGRLEKVRYGLVYDDIKKYLDFEYLRSVLLILRNDKDFLEKLVAFYRNSYSNSITIAQIRNYLLNNCSFRIDIYQTLNNFLINEVFSINKTGEAKLKYKSLHDLAMFVYNYINKKEQNKLGQIDENFNVQRKRSLLELQKSKLGCEKKYTKNNVKKLTKKEIKNIPVEGQISFFD